MKVVWFTNIPLDAVNRYMNRSTRGSGFWMQSLVEPLQQSGQIELFVVTATAGDPAYRFEADGVTYFNIPQHKVLETFGLFKSYRLKGYIAAVKKIVNDIKPDLIHVHGTERFFGLLRSRGMTDVPTVVSIQGIVAECERVAWGGLQWRDVIRHVRLHDLLRNGTPYHMARRFRQQVPLEHEIIAHASAIIGRTAWDRAFTRAINPTLPYFHVDEMLRPDFASKGPWDIKTADPHTLITTSGPTPLKGLDVLIKATALLRRWGYPVRLKVAGTSLSRASRGCVPRFLVDLVDRWELGDAVEMIGWQDGASLADHLLTARCFVGASYIENSSNAISEAQRIGIPVVASHVGGTPTLIEHDHTGLLFNRGDAPMCASQIERLLNDAQLAVRLGEAGCQRATVRHNPQQIISRLLAAYAAVAGSAHAQRGTHGGELP